MYWNWATMYRFIILEAVADTGSGDYDHDLLFHTGLDDLYRTSEVYTIDVNVDANATKKITLSLDWNDLWYNGQEEIDVRSEHITHTTENNEDFDLARRLTENFLQGLSVSVE